MNLGHFITNRRVLQGLSQKQLAALINMTPSYISHLEAGRKQPSIAVWEAICSVLRIKPRDIAKEIKLPNRDIRQKLRLGVCLNVDCSGRRFEEKIPRHAAALSQTDHFCRFCGGKLTFTHSCGAAISVNSIYCAGCGEMIFGNPKQQHPKSAEEDIIKIELSFVDQLVGKQLIRKLRFQSGEYAYSMDNHECKPEDIQEIFLSAGIAPGNPYFDIFFGNTLGHTTNEAKAAFQTLKKEFNKKPLKADISITFNNDSRRLGLDFSEITILKQKDLSGKFRYFINQVQCRAKDIRQMFLGVGINKGAPAFDVIFGDPTGPIRPLENLPSINKTSAETEKK